MMNPRIRIAEMVKQMVTAHHWVCFSRHRQFIFQELRCDASISIILSLYAVPEVTRDGAHARLCRDSAGPPRSHPGDRPLKKSNEIILGEVMLKMNHFLTIP